jgi:preprotein translocase subunit YajC
MNYILWIPLIAVFAWFFLIRPQRNARRRATEVASSLEVGDEVVTIGGLYGFIVTIDDREVELDVAEGVTLRFARRAIAGKAPEQVEDVEDDEDDEELEDDELDDDGELGADGEDDDDDSEDGETPDQHSVVETAPKADESSGR